MLTTLIYRSQLSLTCTSAALSALVEQARIRNTEQGISGILLSRGRDVLQILEGTEQSVVARLTPSVRMTGIPAWWS